MSQRSDLPQRVLDITKGFLTQIGALLPDRATRAVVSFSNYIQLGRWYRRMGFEFPNIQVDRTGLFDSILSEVSEARVLYLEFGVFKGNSMRYWSRGLRNPKAALHGFDSFQGLPEGGANWAAGQFSTGGLLPVVNDPRVRFYKGWFDETLRNYAPPPHDQLVVVMDADLYSSTRTVLAHIGPWLKPGSFIYFDDLVAVDHEPRAIEEFLAESRLQFEPFCAHSSRTHAAFRIASNQG